MIALEVNGLPVDHESLAILVQGDLLTHKAEIPDVGAEFRRVDPAIHVPDILHIPALLRLGLLLFDATLLEKDIRAIEDGRRVAGQGPLLVAEARQLRVLDATRGVEHAADGAQEGGARDVGLAQHGGDLAPHVVARVVDLNRVALLAVELDPRHVEALRRGVRFDFFRRHGHFALGLAVADEEEGGGVGLVVDAVEGVFELHEAPFRVASEMRHFHLATLDAGVDQAADRVAVFDDEQVLHLGVPAVGGIRVILDVVVVALGRGRTLFGSLFDPLASIWFYFLFYFSRLKRTYGNVGRPFDVSIGRGGAQRSQWFTRMTDC